MFANEESVLEYFYEHGEALNIHQLEDKFDNSNREDILKVVTYLEQNNLIVNPDSAIWAMTKKGYRHYKIYYIEARTNYNRRNLVVAIIIGAISTLISIVSLIVSLRH